MCLPNAKSIFKVEREWEHAGLQCAVVQAVQGGHRCGYVRVPKPHAAFGRDLSCGNNASNRQLLETMEVHGGITFSQIEPCAHEDGRGYWFGFDCAHAGDGSYEPGNEPDWKKDFDARSPYTRQDHFWTHEEVVAETERFAVNVAAAANLGTPRSVRYAKRQLRRNQPRRRRREMNRLQKTMKRLIATTERATATLRAQAK